MLDVLAQVVTLVARPARYAVGGSQINFVRSEDRNVRTAVYNEPGRYYNYLCDCLESEQRIKKNG